MRVKQLRGSMLLLLTAIIWGVAFVAQSVGMDYVGPFTFTCVRSVIGGVILLPCIALLNKLGFNAAHSERGANKPNIRLLLCGGISCGIILCLATCMQQIGIMYTSVGKAGFITAFYIIIVPILGLFLKRRCGLLVWIGVIIALFGLYFLCITENIAVQKGDFYVFISAFLFALHIICVDHFSNRIDGLKMSCIQFFAGAILSGILMLLFENPQLVQIVAAWKPILYAGILSTGAGYTLQIIGQRDLDPTVASLIMSLESVIAVLAGLILLNQTLSHREILGCILMFIAIILAQLPQNSLLLRVKRKKLDKI